MSYFMQKSMFYFKQKSMFCFMLIQLIYFV